MKFKFGVDSFIWAEDFKEKTFDMAFTIEEIHIHFQRSR